MATIIGMIGFGRFGKLWAEALAEFGKIKIYDKNPQLDTAQNDKFEFVSLKELGHSDILFILVPISEFENSCLEVLPFLNPNTLIVDCCSVKIYPVQVMQNVFNECQPLIATHPLFGPDSVKQTGSFNRHKIVVCPIRCNESQIAFMESMFKQLGLNVLFSTPEEHDRQMAHSQSLVHFIGRGLAALDLRSQVLATPDFQALVNINQMVINDAWQLFLDMHRFNPYAQIIRKKFVEELILLEEEILMNVTEQSQSALEKLREQINQIDLFIIEKLAQRQKISKQVGRLKAQIGMPVLDSKREEALTTYYEALSKQYEVDPEFVKALFRMIISNSRSLQT